MSCLCKLKSGPRKGERCNAKTNSASRYCGRHAKCKSSRAGTKTDTGRPIPPSRKEYPIELRFYVVRVPVAHDSDVKLINDVSKLPHAMQEVFRQYLLKFDSNHSNEITVQKITFKKMAPYVTLHGTVRHPIDQEFWDGPLAEMIQVISDKSLYQASPRPKLNGFEYFLYHVCVKQYCETAGYRVVLSN
jgi:hypothetical protein